MSLNVKFVVLATLVSIFSDANANNKLTTQCTELQTAFPPEAETKCCGRDSIVGNKLVGGNETKVDQYPWLALIEYTKNDDKIYTLCGGVLISSRYVLTAAHCVTGPLLNLGNPKNVRLGEHDTSNEGPDCVTVEARGKDCNEGATVIAIEETIPHSGYNKKNHNDICLIRLKDAAPFTDFIRPICLPLTDITASPPNQFTFYAAGWGAVSETKSHSAVKLHVELPFVARDKCQAEYQAPGRKAPLIEGQICAGAFAGKDSCKGDSGGPLMYEGPKRTYEVVGIISFGPNPCGMDGVPGVYTKVFQYTDWIKSQIKA